MVAVKNYAGRKRKSCDELVVRAVPAYTYASALLALQKINGTKHLTLAANGHKPFKLLNRIKHFTMKNNPMMTLRQKAFSILLIIIGLGCIAWLSPDKTNKTAKQQQQQFGQALSAGVQNNPTVARWQILDSTPHPLKPPAHPMIISLQNSKSKLKR